MLRVAIIADFLEEKWPSMDLVAEELLGELNRRHSTTIRATLLRPRAVRIFERATPFARVAGIIDRGMNRYALYPYILKRKEPEFDLFHITDHSYAHLALGLPPQRTIVTCHDLDAFRCLISDQPDSRRWYPYVARKLLSGLRRAAVVVCVSQATFDELDKHHLIPRGKLAVIANGVDAAYGVAFDPEADREVRELLGFAPTLEILHIGRPVQRKRLDTLLEVFAKLRDEYSTARLIRVGGPFTSAQESVANSWGIRDAITVLPFVSQRILAAIYRRAAVVLMPSESEGFGLPAAESMACGTPVICSDIPALREVGGDAASYCGVGDVDHWLSTLRDLLQERELCPDHWNARRAAAITRASRFSWATNADKVANLYLEVWERSKHCVGATAAV